MDKVYGSAQEALADVFDGASVLFGGWGSVGVAHTLIKALHERGTRGITVIVTGMGRVDPIMSLLEAHQVKKVISSFRVLGSTSLAERLNRYYREGGVEVEVVPQGTLAERIRAGGAGIPAFFTPAGAGTLVEKGKEKRVFRGKEYILEGAITADLALVKAWRGDRFGNLVYRKGGRNFNPVMATAARVTVAEVDEIAETGDLDPERVGTSGVYVDRVVKSDPALAPKMPYISVDVVGELKTGQSKGLTRELIALRVAKELKEGMCVNLGTGLPSLVTDFIPEGMQVTLHAENGIVGYGRLAREDELDPELVIAGGRYIVLNPGASYCHHADAFAMIRGGHVDVTVLGAYQVSEKGDLANWMVPELEMGGIGGAMDLVTGVKRVIVAMEHTTPSGKPKIVKQCTYPLTGKGVVDTIVSNLALIRVRPQGLVLEEVAQGVTPEEVQQATEPRLILSPDLKTMEL